MANAVLLVSCPDRPGIVAAVTTFVAEHGGNIVDLQQHTDGATRCIRVAVERQGFTLARGATAERSATAMARVHNGMGAALHGRAARGAAGLTGAHCLIDLLGRWRIGELAVDIPVVISNHPDHAEMAAWFGVEYRHLPIVDGDRPPRKRSSRRRSPSTTSTSWCSPGTCRSCRRRCATSGRTSINIHHSFLPSFSGARPYHQAHERGVKLIGVTAHYVTADLDEGPIIDQDVIRVSHRDDVDDCGARAATSRWRCSPARCDAHVEHRTLVYGRRTIVFD